MGNQMLYKKVSFLAKFTSSKVTSR
ncbi:unnamed protein product [Brassicogethes aeneus]|uniref:Uncharacterized protein n=1 Tax=Brassicogethes aeneus TaxID=1431903 RepID=A0A9P0BFW1_BRAAE|nr:unnamed protein product [Brassicogethes aeneus]